MASSKQQHQMITRVNTFMVRTVDQFPKGSMARAICDAITTVMAKLTNLRETKDSKQEALRAIYDRRADAREVLRTWLEKVDLTGSVLDPRWIPWQRRQRTDQLLISVGEAFATAAAPLERQFILQGLPESFLGDLYEAVNDLVQANADLTKARENASSVVREYESTLDDALKLVDRCEALVMNTMTDNLAVMIAWTAARLIPESARRAKSDSKVQSDSAPPAVAAPPPADSAPAA